MTLVGLVEIEFPKWGSVKPNDFDKLNQRLSVQGFEKANDCAKPAGFDKLNPRLAPPGFDKLNGCAKLRDREIVNRRLLSPTYPVRVAGSPSP